jgi:hypothetical protein
VLRDDSVRQMNGIAGSCWPCLRWPLGPARRGCGVAPSPVRRQRARTLRRPVIDDQLTDRHIAGEVWRRSFDDLEPCASDALADACTEIDLGVRAAPLVSDLDLK